MAVIDQTNLSYLWSKIIAKINASSSTVTVDSAMSDTSTNPVQNKVIKAAIDEAKEEVLQLAHDYTDSKTGAISNSVIDDTCT